jgi:NAD-dependent deacetylase
VSFGEPIPTDVLNQCTTNAALADLVLVAGTSATVYPAAGFAIEVKQRGGILLEANLYESEISAICDISLRGPTGEILPRLTAAVSELRREKLS